MVLSELIGKPYKHNGRGPDYFDCYGLVKYIYKEFLDIELPEYIDYKQDWYKKENVLSTQLNKFSDLWYAVKAPIEWDILTFSHGVEKVTNHCGIYIGFDKMIHCYENNPVLIDRISRPYWKKNMTGIMRYK